VCWPICFEEILKRLRLAIPIDGDRVEFAVERVTIEPFDLRQPCRYDLVVDRLTHWFPLTREWIKKSVLMDGLYVFNNPWTVQSMEKATTYAAMIHLGLPIPETWLLPPKAHEPSPDLAPTLERYARLFDLGAIGDRLGYPVFLKPYDGGAWVGVSRADDRDALHAAYDASGKRLMHLQRAVQPFDLFVRVLGVGPQTRLMRYDPSAPLHERYRVDEGFVTAAEHERLRSMGLTINAFFGWDYNSCECLRQDRAFQAIDFANPCPDSQVTSLHYHFPWVVLAQLRGALFCAATRRRMRRLPDWEPFFRAREREAGLDDRLRAYGAIADEHFEADRFREFCSRHLSHLDEVAHEFFATDVARDAVRRKVEALYPAHEVEPFTERFWGLIQRWRESEAGRLASGGAP
jgi:hypothetical protein